MKWAARVATLAVVAGCCGAGAVGTPCAEDGESSITHVVSPALECHSRLCLVRERTAVCTFECSSDGDCSGMGELYCRSGYFCASVPPYPRAVCTCRDP